MHRTYEDILYGSEDTLAPFNKESTPREIEEKLKELHNTASDVIETLLKNRKERLQKMITFIDVEASPRSFTKKFIKNLKDDFIAHIDTIIYKMPDPDRYIGDWEYVKQGFL